MSYIKGQDINDYVREVVDGMVTEIVRQEGLQSGDWSMRDDIELVRIMGDLSTLLEKYVEKNKKVYRIKVEYGDIYETRYDTLAEAKKSLDEYENEGWKGLVIVDENNAQYFI